MRCGNLPVDQSEDQREQVAQQHTQQRIAAIQRKTDGERLIFIAGVSGAAQGVAAATMNDIAAITTRNTARSIKPKRRGPGERPGGIFFESPPVLPFWICSRTRGSS